MQKFNKNFFYPKKADAVAVNQAKDEIIAVMSTGKNIKTAVERIINLGNESEADQEALVTVLKETEAFTTQTEIQQYAQEINNLDLSDFNNGEPFTLGIAMTDSYHQAFEDAVVDLVGEEIGTAMVAIVDELYGEMVNDNPSMRDFLVANIITDVFEEITECAEDAGGGEIDMVSLIGTLNTDIKVLQILTGLDEIGELYKSAAQLLNNKE